MESKNNQTHDDSVSELPKLVKRHSKTMEDFLSTSKLDDDVVHMLRKYDRDGDGTFSKSEVVEIIVELRNALQSNDMLYASNKLFKRLLIAAFIFFVLMLFAMFGLSYAVAAMTANTKVQEDGTLYNKAGTMILATDSVATVISIGKDEGSNGIYCISGEEASHIRTSVLSGRNVMLELGSWNETQNSKHIMAVHADGFQVDPSTKSMCFWSPEQNKNVCMTQVTGECTPHDASGRRKLSAVENTLLRHGRKLVESITCPAGSAVEDITCALGMLFSCEDCADYGCDDPEFLDFYCTGASWNFNT